MKRLCFFSFFFAAYNTVCFYTTKGSFKNVVGISITLCKYAEIDNSNFGGD